jgi:hypothetical protein
VVRAFSVLYFALWIVLGWVKNRIFEDTRKSYAMATLKDFTIEVLKNISPSASLEEIMYKINLAAQVMEGIQDAEQGNTISTDELVKRMDAWGK